MGSREEPAHADLMPTPTSARRGPSKKCQGQGWVCTICPRGQPSFPNVEAALNHERTAHGHKSAALKDDRNVNGVVGMRVQENQLQTVDEIGWDKIGPPRLTTEGLRQWEMHAHVDHVFDLVPFWQRGIDAAEKGEVLRLEEFLEKMEGDGGWRTANEVLGMLGGSASERARGYSGAEWGQPNWAESNAFGWAANGWGVASGGVGSDATERDSGWGIQEELAAGEQRCRDKSGGRVRVKTVRAVGGGGGREELRHFVDAIVRQEAANEERRKQMYSFFEMPTEQKIEKIEETIRFLRGTRG